MLSLARDTPAYVSSPTGFTLKLVLVAASMSHEREFNWTIISERDRMQVEANTVTACLKYNFYNNFIPKQYVSILHAYLVLFYRFAQEFWIVKIKLEIKNI